MAKEIVAKDERTESLLAFVSANRGEFERALPRLPGMEVDRWLRVVLTAFRRNPRLVEASRDSLMACLMECAQAGLEPHCKGGIWFTGPYKNKVKVGNDWKEVIECVPMWDYRAEIAVMRRSGEILDVYAECVWEKDVYELTLGLKRDIKHKPYRGEDHGELIASYAVAKYKDGSETFAWLWRWQIDKHRASSKAPDGPMWANWLEEAAKKSAVHALADYVPMSTSDREMLSADADRLRAGLNPLGGEREPSRVIDMPKAAQPALSRDSSSSLSDSVAAANPQQQARETVPAKPPAGNGSKGDAKAPTVEGKAPPKQDQPPAGSKPEPKADPKPDAKQGAPAAKEKPAAQPPKAKEQPKVEPEPDPAPPEEAPDPSDKLLNGEPESEEEPAAENPYFHG